MLTSNDTQFLLLSREWIWKRSNFGVEGEKRKRRNLEKHRNTQNERECVWLSRCVKAQNERGAVPPPTQIMGGGWWHCTVNLLTIQTPMACQVARAQPLSLSPLPAVSKNTFFFLFFFSKIFIFSSGRYAQYIELNAHNEVQGQEKHDES